MEYRKIENLVYNNSLINIHNFKNKKEYNLKLDSLLIENLKKCIEKRIPIEMNENDLTKIYKIYLKLIKNNYPINNTFINDLLDVSTNKLDYFELIENITE